MEIFIDRTALPLFHPKYYHVLSKGCICVVDSVRKLFVLVQRGRLFFDDCFISKHVSIVGNPESRLFLKWHATLLRPQATLALQSTTNQSHLLLSISDISASQLEVATQFSQFLWYGGIPLHRGTASRRVHPWSLDSLSSNSARHYKRVAECISAAENSVTARYSVCESDLLPLVHQISHVPWSQKLTLDCHVLGDGHQSINGDVYTIIYQYKL